MRKFLFTLVLALSLTGSALAYDTLFLKPHEAVMIELKVDTLRFPELKGVEGQVRWGDPQGNFMTGAEMGLHRTPEGTYFFDGDADGTRLNGYFWYQFAVVPAPGVWYVVRDTVLFTHVWGRPDITSFTLNGGRDASVRRGDSVIVRVGVSDSTDVGHMYLLNSLGDSLFPVYDGYRIDWPLIETEHLFHALYVVAANPCFRDTTTVARSILFDPTGNAYVGGGSGIYAAQGRVFMDVGTRYVVYDVAGRPVAAGVYVEPVGLPPGFYFVNGVKVVL